MEVASGEYEVDLVKVAKTMELFKTDTTAASNLEDMPIVPALTNSLSKSQLQVPTTLDLLTINFHTRVKRFIHGRF